jgi:hypothetical protein
MKKFIVAAAVIGVASLAGVKSAEAQAPSRVGGYGAYPGTYGTYPSTYPNQYPSAEHGRKHRKHEARRENDGDADDARYGQYGQPGQYGTYGYPNSTYGYPNGTYGYPAGTYGYPSSSAPSRVQPNGAYGTYNVPTRAVVPQQQVHSRDRDHDRRGNDRDR